MHATSAQRVVSLKRKHSLERARSRSRLQRGLTNGDLSRDEPDEDDKVNNSPHKSWYVRKWNERRAAFASAKKSGRWHLFHMFAIVALLGVGLMVGSLFVGPAAGLLEIGVSALLFSIFCLIFVRCDEDNTDDKVETGGVEFSDIVIEEKGPDGGEGGEKLACQSGDDDEEDGSASSLLTRSNPRRIPSPLRVFGYEMNFSPIPECSEPGSSASSFLTRNNNSMSRMANSSTGDSLSRVSSKTSCTAGKEGSPITEEGEDFDYDQQLQLKLDDMGPRPIFQTYSIDDDSFDHDLLSLSPSKLSNNSASFDDTDDSITADLSVVTVIGRGDCASSSPKESTSSRTPTPP